MYRKILFVTSIHLCSEMTIIGDLLVKDNMTTFQWRNVANLLSDELAACRDLLLDILK